MPIALSLLAALLAGLFILQKKRALSLGFLFAAIAILWLSSLPVIADRLLWSLEKQHLPVVMADIPAADCIIVLGGALGVAAYPRVNLELTDAVDRVYQAAKMFQMGKAGKVIVTAGNQPWARKLRAEADMIRELLQEWGVPASAILLDRESRNTRENALNGATLVREAGCKSNLLVTSAWHMPRALASFEAVGVTVFPVSVDVRMVYGEAGTVAQFIPRADAQAATSQAILEWMGIWVYRWKGWN